MMKKLFLALSLSTLLPVPVLAAGTHAGEHEHSEAAHSDRHQSDHEHALSEVGSPASADDASMDIAVTLLDTMRFEFDKPLALRRGEVVRFVVTNSGKIPHEFSVGSASEQLEHRKMMQAMPNMVHEDGNTVSVEPGQTKDLVWRFDGDAEVVFACNIPGHAEAGMVRTTRLQP
ncbi:MAG: cupredoxin family protein [Gammaproteobacteria bacterium]|nr:cupredoxin family protein [Gammaproteobacteria bacterium]